MHYIMCKHLGNDQLYARLSSDTTFTLLAITLQRSENSLSIASLEKLSRILSEIASYAAYDTKPSNADCCRKRPSSITRPWRRRGPWKPPTQTPRLSRVPNLRYGNSQAILPEPELRKRTAAIVVDGRTIQQLIVNSKTPNVITAGRRGISHQCADRKGSPNSGHTCGLNPQAPPRAGAKRTIAELTTSTSHLLRTPMQVVGRNITCTI